MKSVIDYLNSLQESEAAVNTVSSGSIADRDVPLGTVQKRKTDESSAYEGDNPLADNIGKFPLINGATAPDVGDGKTDNGHMFKMKQDQQNYTG